MSSPRHLGVPHGRDYTSANSSLTFQNFLSHRTSMVPNTAYQNKPNWGHTHYRGKYFSSPDHASTLKSHPEAYEDGAHHATTAGPAVLSTHPKAPQPQKLYQKTPPASPVLRPSFRSSIGHPIELDKTAANSHNDFRNYLASRNSPKHANTDDAKARWGHTKFRGALFSDPDHNGEILQHHASYEDANAVKKAQRQQRVRQQQARAVQVQQRTAQDIANSRARYLNAQQAAKPLRPHKRIKQLQSTGNSGSSRGSSRGSSGGSGGSSGGSSGDSNTPPRPPHNTTNHATTRNPTTTTTNQNPNYNINHHDLDEYELFASSGKAPTPSEVHKQLQREQRRLQDLNRWANDAQRHIPNGSQAVVWNSVTAAKADVDMNIRYCLILLESKDPHALKLLENVVRCNNLYSDAIVATKYHQTAAAAAAATAATTATATASAVPRATPTTIDEALCLSREEEMGQTKPLSPKRPDDKVPRKDRRKQAWGETGERRVEDEDEDEEDLEVMVDSVLSQSSSLPANEVAPVSSSSFSVPLDHPPMLTSDLTLETVMNTSAYDGDLFLKPADRSSSVAGTTGTCGGC